LVEILEVFVVKYRYECREHSRESRVVEDIVVKEVVEMSHVPKSALLE